MLHLIRRAAEVDVNLELQTLEELADDLGNHILESIGDLDLGTASRICVTLLILLGRVLDVIEEQLRVIVL